MIAGPLLTQTPGPVFREKAVSPSVFPFNHGTESRQRDSRSAWLKSSIQSRDIRHLSFGAPAAKSHHGCLSRAGDTAHGIFRLFRIARVESHNVQRRTSTDHQMCCRVFDMRWCDSPGGGAVPVTGASTEAESGFPLLILSSEIEGRGGETVRFFQLLMVLL
jgi:hypothetical protein